MCFLMSCLLVVKEWVCKQKFFLTKTSQIFIIMDIKMSFVLSKITLTKEKGACRGKRDFLRR